MTRTQQTALLLTLGGVFATVVCDSLASEPNPRQVTAKAAAVQPSGNDEDDVTGLRLATLFSNHMVLQRDKPIKVWGWSDAGDKITVTFAGQMATAKAGKDGKWMVTLDPMPASNQGRELRV